MSFPAQTFTGISQTRFEAIEAKAQQMSGSTASGDSGEAKRLGFDIKWTYNPQTETLVIQCVSKPFFIGEDEVTSQINNLVEETNA